MDGRKGEGACHTGQGKQCGPPPQSLGTGSFALLGDPLLPPLPPPRKGKGLLASMLRASLQCASGHRKSDVTWEGAGGAVGDVQDHAPSDHAPSTEQEAGRLCFNQLIASLGIQQPDQVL